MVKEYPKDHRNVMVTYKKEFGKGPYGDTKYKVVVTKRGFYTKLFDCVAVPPEWRMFNGSLLPHGFGGDKLKLRDIIKWDYCKD